MSSNPLLIDIGPLSCGCSDHVLEDLHKALSEDGDDIWRPHDSIYIRQLVEKISGRGQDALTGLSTDLSKWLEQKAAGLSVPVPAPAEFFSWSPARAEKVLAYLTAKPMDAWSASDYALLVEYLVHAHLPSEFPEQIAELGAKQAAIMGKVQAVAPGLTAGEAAALLAHFSPSVTGQLLNLADIDYSVIDYGMANCCAHVVGFTDSVRYRLKRTILEYEKSVRLEGRQPPYSLQTKLFDDFSELNRDWRRIAITEAGEMANQGFVSSMQPGQKLKRLEQYAGACPFCKKIDGKVATVVDPAKKDKNWDTEIWPGKDNVGRSASPYKRVGGSLVKRTDAELWKLPAGLAHPHCRGTWIPVSGGGVPDDFSGWLFDFLKDKKAKAAA